MVFWWRVLSADKKDPYSTRVPWTTWGWVNAQPSHKAHSALLPGLARPAGVVTRLRSNGALSKPSRLPGRYRIRWDAAHPPKAIRWGRHLNSAFLPASWPSTTATTSPYPLFGRAEGSLLPRGCNSTRPWYQPKSLVGLSCRCTATSLPARRPANRARQIQMGLT